MSSKDDIYVYVDENMKRDENILTVDFLFDSDVSVDEAVAEVDKIVCLVDGKDEYLSKYELGILETKWLIFVSTLSPGEDWVNHKAIEIESHQEPQPRHLHDELGPHLNIVNTKVFLNVLSIWSSKVFIILG